MNWRKVFDWNNNGRPDYTEPRVILGAVLLAARVAVKYAAPHTIAARAGRAALDVADLAKEGK